MDIERPADSVEPPTKVVKQGEPPVEYQRGNTRLIHGSFYDIDYTTPLGERRRVSTYRVFRPVF